VKLSVSRSALTLHSPDYPDGPEARYRERAEECLSRAIRSNDGEVVMGWLDLAARWNELAGHAQRRRTPTEH
jgi:hypothetical protein